MESFNICNEYLVASRERNHNRISLVNNYQEVPELNKSTILMMLLKLLCEVTNNERFSIKYLYETKKPLITYLIIGIIATVVMTFASPPMSGFILIALLISSIADNFKREKDSKWMNYVSTLPIKRSDYVKSYYFLFVLS